MGPVFSPLIPSRPSFAQAQRLNTLHALGLERHITIPFSYDSLDRVRLSPRPPVRTVSLRLPFAGFYRYLLFFNSLDRFRFIWLRSAFCPMAEADIEQPSQHLVGGCLIYTLRRRAKR